MRDRLIVVCLGSLICCVLTSVFLVVVLTDHHPHAGARFLEILVAAEFAISVTSGALAFARHLDERAAVR